MTQNRIRMDLAVLGSVLCILATISITPAQPKLKLPPSSSYRVGDQVDSLTWVYTKELQPVRLKDVVRGESQVVVLILFGGGAPSAPSYHPLRGGIWCPDSFDEFPLQRALRRHFTQKPVQFVPVAVPPAYSDIYGFEKDVFLTHTDDDPLFQSEARRFIELTEKTKETDVLPFQEVYYDPKFRLAEDLKRRPKDGSYGKVYNWQGKFRWHQDPRKYGTPSIWILSGDLKVLREPFVGNNYNDDPPRLNYDFMAVRDAIEGFLNGETELESPGR